MGQSKHPLEYLCFFGCTFVPFNIADVYISFILCVFFFLVFFRRLPFSCCYSIDICTPPRYDQQIMRNLVRRYVTVEQRKAESQGVTEDDVNEIKQDISAFRCEIVEILKGSGMNTNIVSGQAGGKLLSPSFHFINIRFELSNKQTPRRRRKMLLMLSISLFYIWCYIAHMNLFWNFPCTYHTIQHRYLHISNTTYIALMAERKE